MNHSGYGLETQQTSLPSRRETEETVCLEQMGE